MVNFKLSEKQALLDLHILPSDFEKEDFFEMQEILAVTKEDLRRDPMELFKKMQKQLP
ncbi:MAG: hypothetical protein ABF991_05410 [Liquorilactobacillus hordei]|uniref:hypothetical protein n=1 Tax=Liquorilactobacillus hordei TaxID=468911 RepID=UPI0039E9026F